MADSVDPAVGKETELSEVHFSAGECLADECQDSAAAGADETPLADQDEDGRASLRKEWQQVYSGEEFQWVSLLPPLTWVPRYYRALRGTSTPADLEAAGDLPYSAKGDVIAGLTVGCMLVPQCLAFALLAGLPVQAGLYSSVLPLMLYACLGSIRQIQVGPTALMSLLTGEALDSAGITSSSEKLATASFLALLVGLVSFLLGVLRFGFVVDFMSHTVMTSFCSASGVIIATSQLKHVLGVAIPRHHYWWQTAYDLVISIPETDPATAVMGFTLLFMLTFLKSWKSVGSAERRSQHWLWRWFPKRKESWAFRALKLVADLSSIACVVIGWIWGLIYRSLGIMSVKLIGDSGDGGLIFALPEVSGPAFLNLIVPAILIAVVGFLETVAVGGKLASENRYSYDANQELLAIGLANAGGAVMGGFPITGGFSRTAVNAMFGATSQMAGGLTSLVVLIAVYLLMPVVERLPLAALAPLIIHGAIGITDFGAFVTTFKGNLLEFVIMLATFGVSLGLTVKEGLLTGISLSILDLVHRTARPNMAVCGRVRDGTFRDIRYYPEAEMIPGCLVVRIDASLCFANTDRFKNFCLRAADVGSSDGSKRKFVVMDCKSVNGTDMTGCEMIEVLASSLQKRGQVLLIANLKAPFTRSLCQAGVHETLAAHGGHLCWGIDQALAVVDGKDPEDGMAAVLDLKQRINATQPSNFLRRFTRR